MSIYNFITWLLTSARASFITDLDVCLAGLGLQFFFVFGHFLGPMKLAMWALTRVVHGTSNKWLVIFQKKWSSSFWFKGTFNKTKLACNPSDSKCGFFKVILKVVFKSPSLSLTQYICTFALLLLCSICT